jgi:hypothetical protein
MKLPIALACSLLALAAAPCLALNEIVQVKSPDGKLAAEVSFGDSQTATYAIRLNNQLVLRASRLGLVRDDEDFSKQISILKVDPPAPIEDRYQILTAKRRDITYSANRAVFHFQSASGKKMDIIFQVSNDGVAFRYLFPETSGDLRKLTDEVSSFHFLPDTTAWLQPMSVAKTGFAGSNPSYEEYYQKGIAAGTPSTLGAGWVYPALFRSGDAWLLVSEAGLGRNYCGTRLRHLSPDAEYSIGFPDPRESQNGGPVNPESKLPWETPWRIIAVGSLKTIVESTLGTDLADKPAPDIARVESKPGRSSWSWPLLGDNGTRFDTQKRFIDHAADMGWEYCLVDALWDRQIGEARMKELVDYAAAKKVSMLVWYNSAGSWNTTPQTPRDKMLTHESRVAEFRKLKDMGIKGAKVDFFGGDGQSVITYYHDILQDAAAFGMQMNFHGATLPRGWNRTYPNLMTMEAIKGFEFMTFEQRNADEEPLLAAIIPFTRNVFDPMDFTPVSLGRLGQRTRRTTVGFELALSVIFQSGIQHYPETPEVMAAMPAYVKDFLRAAPASWEETKFIDGFPGKFTVLARKAGGRWFLAGINGENEPKELSLDLAALAGATKGMLITDATAPAAGTPAASFEQKPITIAADRKLSITLKPRGGFVVAFE